MAFLLKNFMLAACLLAMIYLQLKNSLKFNFDKRFKKKNAENECLSVGLISGPA